MTIVDAARSTGYNGIANRLIPERGRRIMHLQWRAIVFVVTVSSLAFAKAPGVTKWHGSPHPDSHDSLANLHAGMRPLQTQIVDSLLPFILDSWKLRVSNNHGVHAWSREHAGMRVWQEWIALLTLARNESPEVRRRTGLQLQKYVVGQDIKPLGFVGTSLPVPVYNQGDFDMSLLSCTSMLALFEHDRTLLTDATLVHLLKNVFRVWGQTPKSHFNVGFVSVPETENHLFMTESSRYLTNQMIWENKRKLPQLIALRDSLMQSGEVIDNAGGSLKRLLLQVMQQTMLKGLFEFNAQIYQRFTIHALDNLYSFSTDKALATGAGCLLDYLATVFAFQSYGGIRYGPYRRSSEVYNDSSLIGNDAACSFFGVQSGVYALAGVNGEGLWHTRTAHSSMALFSAVLKYRVPEPILAFMRKRPGEYRAEIRSAYAGKGMRKRVTEAYHGGQNFLLTAGGRYEDYLGPNFPSKHYWFSSAPWVYDVITRSSSLILNPQREQPRVLSDILHFRGAQWRANNMSLQGNFLYGYSPVDSHNSPEWPQHVPTDWTAPVSTFATRDFDFQFLDRSDVGVYVVLSRLRPSKTYLKWDYQKYLRGGVEVVDTASVASLALLQAKTLEHNTHKARWPLGPRRYTYVDFFGSAMHLNSRYDGDKEGILKVTPPKPINSALEPPAVALPFLYPGSETPGDTPSEKSPTLFTGFWASPKTENPLFQVELTSPWKGKIAVSDGQGNMYVFNPATGGYCLANFREWWNPRRVIHP